MLDIFTIYIGLGEDLKAVDALQKEFLEDTFKAKNAQIVKRHLQ